MELGTCQFSSDALSGSCARTAYDNSIVAQCVTVVNLAASSSGYGNGSWCHLQRISAGGRVVTDMDSAYHHIKSVSAIVVIKYMGDVWHSIAPCQTTVHTVQDGVDDITADTRGGCHGSQG